MMEPQFLKRLRRIVGKNHVRTSPADLEVYAYDASLARARPGAVAFPADTSETAALVKAACEAGIPYVPRGFGTNLSGGSLAPPGGLVICLSRMNRILSIRPEARTARVQPCVTNLDLQEALARVGFFYAPDPASQKVATLGGNVAENSGGPRCVKYGVTRNHVLGLEVVLPGGETVRVGGEALDPPGYDLCGILVGSEGTLGIVTEITVRILPSPESTVTLLAVYDDVSDAARSVSEITAIGIIPACLEMMDGPIMRAVEESYPCGYPLDASAVLIIELDGPAAGLKALAHRVREICAANRCRQVREARDARERDLLWAGRRGAFGAIARLAPNYLVADCTVPRSRLPEALSRVAAIARNHGLSHGNVFHAGDGNLHPLLLFDSRDPDQLDRVRRAGWEIMKECVALGGTITGEHGVGVEKVEAMGLVFSTTDMDAQNRIRQAFDPQGLLNPGKVLPGPTPRAPVAELPPGKNTSGREEWVPVTPGEACEMVRQAYHERTPLLPLGGGHWKRFGNPSGRGLRTIRSTAMASIREYDPPNQTVTVEAGVVLAILQDALVQNQQWLPLRPFPGLDTTVGGIVGMDNRGPERLRYGAPRDLVLGLRFVAGTGRLVSAGGKVVKNVAGYDLCRLLVGSAGSLGFITEVTFRVAPLPEHCRAVLGIGGLAEVARAASTVLASNLDPTFVSAYPEGPAGEPGRLRWTLMVGLEGFGHVVDAQENRCRTLFAGNGLEEEPSLDYGPLEGVHAGQDARLACAAFRYRADVPLDKVAEFIDSGLRISQVQGVLVDFGCGRVRAGLEGLPGTAWQRLGKLAARLGGHILLESAPEDFREHHDAFGVPQPARKIMSRIKEALDPRGIFAPGRLPGDRSASGQGPHLDQTGYHGDDLTPGE